MVAQWRFLAVLVLRSQRNRENRRRLGMLREAYLLVPYQTNGAQSLLSQLEVRLASAASSDDKYAVFLL